MSASSQTPRPPEPEPPLPECCRCGSRRGPWQPDPSGARYPSGAQQLVCATPCAPVQAAAGVITAAMAGGHITAAELAQAEADAGILFDPQKAEDIAAAARGQARAEGRAELEQLCQENASLLWFKDRLQSVLALCAGRPNTDLMTVREILQAADSTLATGVPLTLTWDETVDVPHEGAGAARVRCTTSLGSRAVLALDQEQRFALASLLDAEVRDVTAPCPTEGCGSADELDESDPAVWGWSRLQVAGTEGPARWYCSPFCVSNAVARAGAELAAAGEVAEGDGLDARYGPGASDEYALQVAEAAEAALEDRSYDQDDADEYVDPDEGGAW